MRSIPVKAFLSHQQGHDRINWLIQLTKSICTALDINCENLSFSTSDTPIEEAKHLIKNSNMLIALCTREKKFEENGGYSFSTAVSQEIMIANEMEKPIVIFAEQNVPLKGFFSNICAYDKINLSGGITIELIEQLIKGIHREKVKSITDSQLDISQEGNHHYHLEKAEILIELFHDSAGEYTWQYILEKSYKFNSLFQLPLKFGVWTAYGNEMSSKIDHAQVDIIEESNAFETNIHRTELGHQGIDISVTLDPFPDKDDHIRFREKYISRGFNPIYFEHNKDKFVHIRGKSYNCFDGLALINRVENLVLRIKFPKGYPIDASDIVPACGTFSTTIDFIVEREVERIEKNNMFEIRSFNDELELTLEVSTPLFQHFYGFLWNAPQRPPS